MKHASIIFKKEIKEIIKNRNIWMPILVITLMFSLAMPFMLTYFGKEMLEDPDTIKFLNKTPFLKNLEPYQALIFFMTKQFLIFLLLIPAMVPSLIAPFSIIMEKENKTLEPLLATPIKTSDLLLGKTLTSMVPTFVISTASFVILSTVVDAVTYREIGQILLPNLEWCIVAFVLSPTIEFIITMASIMISSKSTDVRSAQGIGSVVIFPIYLLIGLQLAGFFLMNIKYLIAGCIILIALCPLLLRLA
ncbi:MAG: ABC transporter permease subunit, partial [Actinobacteria bacterium]|nr:ABC transporter permease subunit [Actinomycetota bacterium]